ncbi:MAG: DUF4132 domain-containing protein [Alphaproteobacteria bacterium]|nr:DUF4132 domain-containing protein [Alphaproteobacteria bacterium]
MERYELAEGGASKFWEVSVEGTRLTVCFGRIGTDGQTKVRDFASGDAATSEKNRLVREKTGKGYALAGSGTSTFRSTPPATAPEPSTAARRPVTVLESIPREPPSAAIQSAGKAATPTASVSSAELDIYLARALPTRCRPQDGLNGTASWRALRALLLPMMAWTEETQPDAVLWLRQNLSETGPESIHAHEAVRFIGNILGVADQLLPQRNLRSENGWVKSPQEIARFRCMMHFMNWLTSRATPEIIADMTAGIILEIEGRSYALERSGWSSVPALALRAAVVRTPEKYYERLVARFATLCAPLANLDVAAHIAFILADDRPGHHDLQALAVLNAAEAAGVDVAIKPAFLPLILDSPPSRVAHIWTGRSYFPPALYSEVRLTDAAATAIAVARHNGEAAQPTLDWLYQFARDGQKTELAQLILALDEDAGFPALLLETGDKHVRTALDHAVSTAPARTFRQCLTAVACGRPDTQLTGRIMAVISSQKPETLRQWAGTDSRALRCLERMLDGLEEGGALAPPQSWPNVLRDPPWRRKARAADDIVLQLTPFATPFAYTPADKRQPNYHSGGARIVPSMQDLPAVIAEIEAKAKSDTWHRTPAPLEPPPPHFAPEADQLKWLEQRLIELHKGPYHTLSGSGYSRLFDGIDRQPDALALMLWQSGPPVLTSSCRTTTWRGFFPDVMARFGERALPGLLRQMELDPVLLLENTGGVEASEIAPHAARALFKLKKARVPAASWLRKYRRTAILRLIPDAVGPKGQAREAAEHALRWLTANTDNGRAEIEHLAKGYAGTEPHVGDALAQVLDRDPLACYPARIARLPAWLVPGALHRPELVAGGALPDAAVSALAEMLSFSAPDAVYAGIDVVRQQTTRQSLAAFAWDLFSAWLANGAPSKDGWAMRAVGWLGDDECARRLTQLIRKWPGESAHARAVTGLDVLADIGSDIALMNLNGIAEKLKFKGLQERAREKITALAEARDLTAEELADRLAPDLNLDERGGLDLVFGERRFRVGFDEFLKPWVKDSTGQRLKDLPKPNKSDDPEMSAEAVARWKVLKKDARSIASLQITRLENMLSTSRRTRPDVFWTFFASHPLVRHLTQRLIWGVYADDSPRTTPTVTFRVTDDLSITDGRDEPLELDVSQAATGCIGLIHPLQFPAGGLDAWGALFGDYEIAQPFPQLSREIFELTEAEKAVCEILRFQGITVESTRIRGMGSRGWQLGEPQDGGAILWIQRKLRLEDGTVETAMLDFSDGYIVPGSPEDDEAPKLDRLTFDRPYQRAGSSTRRFGEIDPVSASEMLRGLHLLVASQQK